MNPFSAPNPFARGPIYKIKTFGRPCPICKGERYRYGRTCPDCGRNFVAEELARQQAAQAEQDSKRQEGAQP